MVHEAMNEIMTSSHISENQQLADPWNRKHFESPALENVDKLSTTRPQDIMSVSNLAAFAINVRLNEVVRWKPRNVSTLITYALVFLMVCCAENSHADALLLPHSLIT